MHSISPGMAQSPVISYASSFYKTTAGAIGTHGIVSTTTYSLVLASTKTIILNQALIDGFVVDGAGIIIPTNKDGTIAFRIIVYTHQKDSTWYEGEIEFEGIKVPAKVQQAPKAFQNSEISAVTLYLKSNRSNYEVTKQKLDEVTRHFNK